MGENIFLNQKGQSIVEYILLMGVLVLIASTVLRSDAFKALLGPESQVFDQLRKRMQYTYRHGIDGEKDETGNELGTRHESYFANGQTRFFSPRQGYPKQ